ncbi:MAG: Eco57I restriction-modification methylase domain-containing protein, partial [Cruoricaptor ignavus]|nr:Eco57I restriction-modification methylase domain-containing protein [Cruoricaptor ignavus]
QSPFSERMKVELADFKTFESEEKYDIIVSNPPYFEANNSTKDILARQNVELNFSELIEKSAMHLSEKGLFSVIIPSDSAADFIEICEAQHLFLRKKINIFGMKNGALKRNILEFSFTPNNVEETDFVIEKSPRTYSEEYLKLTEDFHIFG